jgi:LuxR family glucitol operon transcriptional activator
LRRRPRAKVTLTADDQEELWKRTGGLPLAIVWSIGLVDMGETVKTVLRRLGQGQSDIARFCFDGSVARIRGANPYKLLLALAIFESEASHQAIGYVAGLDDDEFARDEGLGDLVRLSLINRDDQRFSIRRVARHVI